MLPRTALSFLFLCAIVIHGGEESRARASRHMIASATQADILMTAEDEEPAMDNSMQSPSMPFYREDDARKTGRATQPIVDGLGGMKMPVPLTVSLPDASFLEKGKEARLTFYLKDKNGSPASQDGMSLFVIDQGLVDYRYVQAQPGKEAGSYVFSLTPATAHDYRVFVELWPSGGAVPPLSFLLKGAEPCRSSCVDRSILDTARAGEYSAYVTFSRKDVPAGRSVVVTVNVSGKDGEPVETLEPLRGAFAHVVGFYDDFETMDHFPLAGFVPESVGDAGSSPVSFVMKPQRAGYVRFFVETMIAGKSHVFSLGKTIVADEGEE